MSDDNQFPGISHASRNMILGGQASAAYRLDLWNLVDPRTSANCQGQLPGRVRASRVFQLERAGFSPNHYWALRKEREGVLHYKSNGRWVQRKSSFAKDGYIFARPELEPTMFQRSRLSQ